VVISNGSGSENVWYLQTLFPLDWLTERCRISSRVSLVQSTCWRMVVLGAAEHEKDRERAEGTCRIWRPYVGFSTYT
jgi:hypothetical protein